MEIAKLSSAKSLSDHWDNLAGSYFQQKKFLHYTEIFNPCNQRYYEVYEDNLLRACACVYTLTLDLFTFSNIHSPIKFTIVGIPASISDSGIFGEENYVKDLIKHIFQHESGVLLYINVPHIYKVKPALLMHTLPTIEFRNSFNTWDDYYSSLRSNYRRRLNKFADAFKEIKVNKYKCSELNEEMYALYQQIMMRTKNKLEVLSFEFFRNLPDEFCLNAHSLNQNVISWNICLEDKNRFVFFFGGLDYPNNNLYCSYFNNLTGILKEGIEMEYKIIEFGQTAEVPKLKLGGEMIEKHMLIYHKNPLIRSILQMFRKLLEYQHNIVDYHVFKQSAYY